MSEITICIEHKKENLFVCLNAECDKSTGICSSCILKYHSGHQTQSFDKSEKSQNSEGVNNAPNKQCNQRLFQELIEDRELNDNQGVHLDLTQLRNTEKGSVTYNRKHGYEYENKVTKGNGDKLIISQTNVYDIPNQKQISLKLNKFKNCDYLQFIENDILVSLTEGNVLTVYDASDITNLITLKESQLPLTRICIDFGGDDLLAYAAFNSIIIMNWRCDQQICQIVTKAHEIKKIQFLFSAAYICIVYKEYKRAPQNYCAIYCLKTKQVVFDSKYDFKIKSIHETNTDEFVITTRNSMFIYKSFELINIVKDCFAVKQQSRIGKEQLFVYQNNQISILNTQTLAKTPIKQNPAPKKYDNYGCFTTIDGEIAILFTSENKQELHFIY